MYENKRKFWLSRVASSRVNPEKMRGEERVKSKIEHENYLIYVLLCKKSFFLSDQYVHISWYWLDKIILYDNE